MTITRFFLSLFLISLVAFSLPVATANSISEAINLYNRANSKVHAGDINGAISDFNKAISLNPKFAEAYLNLGDARSAHGDYLGAIANFDQAIQINPKFMSAYVSRGDNYFKLGNYQKAYENADKSIELEPLEPSGYCNRGEASLKLGLFEESLSDFNKSIAIKPNLWKGEAFYYRSAANKRLGNFDQAKIDEASALNLGFQPSKLQLEFLVGH